MSEFIRVFAPVFKRVFKGQKICLRYFKIGQTYFEICALYFLFAPMWGKRAENQFSLFLSGNRRFFNRIFFVLRLTFYYTYTCKLTVLRVSTIL